VQFISPFTACIRQSWVQVLMIGTAIFQLVEASNAIITFRSFGVATYSDFRLKDTRNSVSGNFSFHLLKDGCSIASRQISLSVNDSHISLSQPNEVNGFQIILGQSSHVVSTNSIVLEGSRDRIGWATVGSSNFRRVAKGIRISDGSPKFDQSLNMKFDFRAPWPLYSNTVVSPFLFAVGCICTALCGAYARLWKVDTQSLGKSIFVGLCFTLALHSFAVGVGYLSLDMKLESFLPFNESIGDLILSAVLGFREMFFFDALRLVALYILACRAVNDCILFSDCSYLLQEPPVQALACGIVGTVFITIRHRFLVAAINSVNYDRSVLNDKWDRLLEVTSEKRSLEALAAAAERASACVGIHARQLNRARLRTGDEISAGHRTWPLSLLRPVPQRRSGTLPVIGELEGGFCEGERRAAFSAVGGENVWAEGTLPGEIDPTSPVQCLDQLYSQALGLALLLRGRCVAWAAASCGAVAMGQTAADQDSETGQRMSAVSEWMRLGFVKSPARAAEKVLVCYGGDASRLLDVCRGRILFGSAADLARCLELMLADAAAGAVQIVRIRNSLCESFDAWVTAGFRVQPSQSI
jgi:hypothetical protein